MPSPPKLIIKQFSGQPRLSDIRKSDHVFLFEPKLKRQRLKSKLPMQRTLDHLHKTYGPAASILEHPGDTKAPSLCYTQYTESMNTYQQLTLARKMFAKINSRNVARIIFVCNDKREDIRHDLAEALAATAHAHQCPLTTFKKKKPKTGKARYLDIYGCAELNIKRLKAEAHGNNIGRVLAALPPNVLNAANYIETCRQLARKIDCEYELFDQSRLKSMGANAFLAVAQGNPHASAGIVKLRHHGEQQKPWLSLVGKGVCFDTGGVNLKDASGMQEMHEDMQGSSVALGSFLALRELSPDKTIECWLAITENRLDGEAYTPTEIITAVNGTTIEIMHSDAEGRMVLADTLHLASAEKPEMIIDYATLTGACVYALTERYNGAFSNRDVLNATTIAAGNASGERAWPFPVDEDFDQLISSDYADVKQCAVSGLGDHIAAARFLTRFVDKKIPWLHIDLAASHCKGGSAHVPTDVTGSGVRFTCNFILDQLAHEVVAASKAAK